MADLLDFKGIQIVGARMVGASIIKTAQMFGVSTGTVSKVIISFEKENKTSQQSISLALCRTLHLNVRKDRRTTVLKIIFELNEHPQKQLSTKTSVESFTKNILRKSCNSKTYAFTEKCFKSFRVVYGLSELVS